MKKSILFGVIVGIILIVLWATDSINFWGFLGLAFVFGMISTLWYDKKKKKERKKQTQDLENQLLEIENFSPSRKLVGPWGLIAIDDDSQQIALKENEGPIYTFPYQDIMGCEILEDGNVTYRKSSTIGRSIVGGAIAGAPGAIIGGLSGKRKENKKIKNLDFKVVVKDTQKPNFVIRFYDAWEQTGHTKESVKVKDSVDSPELQKSLDDLKEWRDVINIIIDKVDEEQKKNSDE